MRFDERIEPIAPRIDQGAVALFEQAMREIRRLTIPTHAENMAALRQHQPITCAECQAGPLTEFHTSKRDSRTLCRACFERRADKDLAKEEGQPLRTTNKRHPLDAWMERT